MTDFLLDSGVGPRPPQYGAHTSLQNVRSPTDGAPLAGAWSRSATGPKACALSCFASFVPCGPRANNRVRPSPYSCRHRSDSIHHLRTSEGMFGSWGVSIDIATKSIAWLAKT